MIGNDRVHIYHTSVLLSPLTDYFSVYSQNPPTVLLHANHAIQAIKAQSYSSIRQILNPV